MIAFNLLYTRAERKRQAVLRARRFIGLLLLMALSFIVCVFLIETWRDQRATRAVAELSKMHAPQLMWQRTMLAEAESADRLRHFYQSIIASEKHTYQLLLNFTASAFPLVCMQELKRARHQVTMTGYAASFNALDTFLSERRRKTALDTFSIQHLVNRHGVIFFNVQTHVSDRFLTRMTTHAI